MVSTWSYDLTHAYVNVSLSVNGVVAKSAQLTLPPLLPPIEVGETVREVLFVTGAFPMIGSEAILAVSRHTAVAEPRITSCPDPKPHNCQESGYYAYRWRPKGATIYRVNLALPGSVLGVDSIRYIPDSTVYDVALSEDGREKLFRIGSDEIWDNTLFPNDSYATSLACNQSWSPASIASLSTTFAAAVSPCLSTIAVLILAGVGTSAPRVVPNWVPQPTTRSQINVPTRARRTGR